MKKMILVLLTILITQPVFANDELFSIQYLCTNKDQGRIYFTYLISDWKDGVFSSNVNMEFDHQKEFVERKVYTNKIQPCSTYKPVDLLSQSSLPLDFESQLQKTIRQVKRYRQSGIVSIKSIYKVEGKFLAILNYHKKYISENSTKSMDFFVSFTKNGKVIQFLTPTQTRTKAQK